MKDAIRILAAPPARIDQGLLFSCALAEDYVGCSVRGLVITARCDAAQARVNTYSYIPVVRLRDWLLRDFSWIAGARAEKDAAGSLRSILVQAGHSAAVMRTEPLRSILSTLFPETADKRAAKTRAAFEVLVARHEIAVAARLAPSIDQLRALHREFPKLCEGTLSECLYQKLVGYYFLSCVEPDEKDSEGYVALLREVRHIPRKLAEALVGGIDVDDFRKLQEKDPACVGKLAVSEDEFAMPIGLLRSPDIEHLMQDFSMLFARIGIEDRNADYAKSIVDLHLGDHVEGA